MSVFTVLVTLIAAGAPAPDEATLNKMVDINRRALEALKAGHAETARNALLDAVTVGKQAGLTSHQMMARTYLHLGAVYLVGFKDREKAIAELALALKIRPTIQITPQLASPAMAEAFEAAKKGSKGSTAEAKPPADVDEGDSEAKPETKPEPKAEAKPEHAAAAKPEPAAKPATLVSAKAEIAVNKRGRGGKRGRRIASAKEAVATEATTAAAASADAETASDDAEDELELKELAPQPASRSRWWLGLGVGSGAGWHGPGEVEGHPQWEAPSGSAMAALVHFTPELGYRYSDRLGFSLQTRHQIIPSSGEVEGRDERPRMAHAVFLRAHGLLHTIGAHLEVWGTAQVGAGSAFRLYLAPKPENDGLPASGTVSAGPIALGPGASLVYRAGEHLALIAELRALVGVWRMAVLGELNLGVSYAF